MTLFRNRTTAGQSNKGDFSYINYLFDQVIEAVNSKAGADGAGPGEFVLNNSSLVVRAGLIYGRDSAGKITEASPTVQPLYYADSGASPGQNFKAKKWGQVRVLMSDSGQSLTIGDEIYIASGGKATTTHPTSGNIYRIGWVAQTVKFNGYMNLDLDLSEKAMLF